MCNEAVKQKIVEQVCAKGRVSSDTASMRELKMKLEINTSNSVFSKALGCAIRNSLIIRHRPAATGLYDDVRPITLLPGPAASSMRRPDAQPLPYFAS